MIREFLFGCGSRARATSWGLLVLRVAVGLLMAIGHGWPKLAKFTDLKDSWFVPKFLGFVPPPLSLVLTIGAEFVAALLLAFGFLTRPAALMLGVTMAVAAFAVHGNDPWFLGPGVAKAKELALLYLVPALVLIITGAGGLSIDGLISSGGKPKRKYV